MSEPVILEAVRTPFARREGLFRETRPVDLLKHALQGVVTRVGLEPAKIDDVIAGNVTQVGEHGANIGRRAVLAAEFPIEVPGISLNRMCGSSQQAVHFAAQAIAAGDMTYAIGSGVESMTRVPMMSDIVKPGESFVVETVAGHRLVHQGESAEMVADKWGITREEVDDFSAESHRRAAKAQAEGRRTEILPTWGIDKEGNAVKVDYDEGVRDKVNREKMGTLSLAFRPEGKGVVTAANSSQISDGASAVLVADLDAAKSDGFRPKARFRSRVVVGHEPTLQLMAVIPATQKALQRAGLKISDLDWIEINEAFATVVLAWGRELKPDWSKVNPTGGAIAHGHPLGATGGGLMAKMIAGLEATGGTLGLQVMCIGHGMATATVIERM